MFAINGYPPCCEKVMSEPRVKCLMEEKRMKFYCPELLGADKGSKGKLEEMGGFLRILPGKMLKRPCLFM